MIIHTVAKGDTLYGIGRRYGVTIEQLLAANGGTVEPALIAGQAVVIPQESAPGRSAISNGYAYPQIAAGELSAVLPYLSLISPFSCGIRRDGTLVEPDDGALIASSESAGVRPVLIVTTLNDDGRFSSETAAAVLSDPKASRALCENIVAKLQTRDYFGVDVDFEYVPPSFKRRYPEFIAELRALAAPLGYRVMVSLAPKTSADQKGLLYEAHDYAALGAAADYALIMTYEWGYTYGPPMAVAPVDKVEEVVRYAAGAIPPDKILLGIPNYAYDWTLPFTRGRAAESMSNVEAVTRARQYGAEIQFDETAKTPYYGYYAGDGSRHEVWFEDARSTAAKLELVERYALAGWSVWNVMSFYQPMFTVMRQTFGITKL